jgi:hypothetical protein
LCEITIEPSLFLDLREDKGHTKTIVRGSEKEKGRGREERETERGREREREKERRREKLNGVRF